MIYFDAAATNFQKPRTVKDTVRAAMDSMSSPGRGNYPTAALAAKTLFQCRMELGELFGVENPEQVVFTSSATHGLNIAIRSLVRPGGRVVVSGYEHNAVTRVLHAMEGLTIYVVNTPLFDAPAMVRGFEELVTPDTDAVICTHVSNVFGYLLPVEEIAGVCRRSRVPLILDASQSAGCIPIDQRTLGAAFIAMPGHKGLYGPQGTGVLLCGEEGEPLLYGGTGSSSQDQQMPGFLPDRMEAGTHNVPGIAGLLAGLRFVRTTGLAAIRHHGTRLKDQLLTALEGEERYQVFGSRDAALQTGVLSLVPRDGDPETLCEYLSAKGIALRGGLHCAPYAHRTAGTLDTGTARFSVSAFNRPDEVERLIEALKKYK